MEEDAKCEHVADVVDTTRVPFLTVAKTVQL